MILIGIPVVHHLNLEVKLDADVAPFKAELDVHIFVAEIKSERLVFAQKVSEDGHC